MYEAGAGITSPQLRAAIGPQARHREEREAGVEVGGTWQVGRGHGE